MFSKIDPKNLHDNVFSMIGDQWMLIAAGDRTRCNMMTASWGGLGVLWNRKVATVYIRPQRYTYEFMEKCKCFSLSFFGPEFRSQLQICGSKSGRDIDKVKESGLTVKYSQGGTPCFAEAELVLLCRKLYYSDIDPSHFLDPSVAEYYKSKDYHRLYIGEITEAFENQTRSCDRP
jgi:flavin reductase (DIM6/NTAB) family NADH-FMN oxidoreductase RutF